METKRSAILAENSTPAFIVAGNNDLLTEILKRLPVISLLRFKSVCKHWLSLITDPHFTRLLNPKVRHPSGFFLRCNNNDYDFVPLDGDNLIKPPFTRLDPPPDLFGTTLTILGSCNGLFCCGNISCYSRSIINVHIYNPSNQKFAILPQSHVGARNVILGVNLVFDPSKSPTLYKVVCLVLISRVPGPMRIRIHIYSSETGNWKPSVDFQVDFPTMQIKHVVYFNGAIHWYIEGSSMRSFNVDQEQLHIMPMPPLSDESGSLSRNCLYFGESSGHLHLIETYGTNKLQFSVFDMERDYSGWCLKFKISLNAMLNTYPEMRLESFDTGPTERWFPWYPYKVLYVFEDESRENSYMVLFIPGKIIRYSLVENTCELLFDYDPPSGFDYFSNPWALEAVFPFIPSLSRI